MCVFAVCTRHFQRCVAGSSVSSSIFSRMCICCVRAHVFSAALLAAVWAAAYYQNVCICVFAVRAHVFSAALLAGSLSSSIITIMCICCARTRFQRCVAGSSVSSNRGYHSRFKNTRVWTYVNVRACLCVSIKYCLALTHHIHTKIHTRTHTHTHTYTHAHIHTRTDTYIHTHTHKHTHTHRTTALQSIQAAWP